MSGNYVSVFVWLPEPVQGLNYDEYIGALTRWVDEHESEYSWTDEIGETVLPSVIVAHVRPGQAGGVYRDDVGRRQFLGGQVAVPERLQELMNDAASAVVS